MKLGQLISLQGEDVLPPEFAQALAVLRSSAAPMPPEQLHRVLGREYGKGWERALPSSTTSRSPRRRSARCTARARATAVTWR